MPSGKARASADTRATQRPSADPINALNRAEDVTFAIDRMLALSRQTTVAGFDPFKGSRE